MVQTRVTINKKSRPRDAIKPKVQRALDAGNVQEVIDNLTTRQRRFVEEYVVDYDGAAAVSRAGYNTKWPARMAYEMLQHPGIKAAIDQLTLQRAEQTTLKPDYVMKKIKRTIEKAEQDGNHTAVLRGCEILARALGMFVDKTEISGPDGKAIEVEQRTKEEAEQLIKTLEALAKRNTKTEVELL